MTGQPRKGVSFPDTARAIDSRVTNTPPSQPPPPAQPPVPRRAQQQELLTQETSDVIQTEARAAFKKVTDGIWQNQLQFNEQKLQNDAANAAVFSRQIEQHR